MWRGRTKVGGGHDKSSTTPSAIVSHPLTWPASSSQLWGTHTQGCTCLGKAAHVYHAYDQHKVALCSQGNEWAWHHSDDALQRGTVVDIFFPPTWTPFALLNQRMIVMKMVLWKSCWKSVYTDIGSHYRKSLWHSANALLLRPVMCIYGRDFFMLVYCFDKSDYLD